MAFPQAWWDELMAKNDIVTIVSPYTELKPKGPRLWGLCPLHGEKTPSFSVVPAKEMFKCFGCGAGGGVVQFIMAMERLSKYEAIQYLATRAGMELPRDVDDEAMRRQRALRERLYAATQQAARFFCEQFIGEAGQAARDYATKRGLSREIVLRYGIGFAPDSWDALCGHLTRAGFDRKELIAAGLLMHNKEKDRVYDAFRNRLIFPILSTDGRVLGFGGRVMGDENPKYINTGDTPIYNKRDHLYGLHLQKNAKPSELIMVEGYMDVIGLYQAGVTNAVASLGTALTQRQAKLLKRYTETVVIAYDGDSAGQNATLRGLDILADEGLAVRVIRFPDKLDPDDYVKRFGKQGFDGLKENACTLHEFKLDCMAAGVDFGSENAREQYTLRACAYIAGLEPVERERFLKQLADKTGYDLPSLRAQLGRKDTVARFTQTPPTRGGIRRRKTEVSDARTNRERTLMASILQDENGRAFVLAHKEGARDLIRTPAYGALYDTCLSRGAAFSLPTYVRDLEPEEAEIVSAILREEGVIGDAEKACRDCIRGLRALIRDEEIEAMKELLAQPGLAKEEYERLMREYTKLLKEK